MKGFKDFLLRGNIVDLAVAVIIGAAFSEVIKSLTVVLMDLIGKLGGLPDFSAWVPFGFHIGGLLTSIISFTIVAGVIYFVVVKPMSIIMERVKKTEEAKPKGPTSEELLAEIRDLLAKQ